MAFLNFLKKWMGSFLEASLMLLIISIGTIVIIGVYFAGYFQGFNAATNEANSQLSSLVSNFRQLVSLESMDSEQGPTPTPVTIFVERNTTVAPPNWGGPELWGVVNNRRQQLGVNALGQRDELCTVASIRLNELLELGKLDGHAGFSSLPERREDLKWIYEKYNLSEFLLSGAQSAQEAASLWENTLGHKKLLTGGEYVWGCIYAQNSFAVAITAF